MITIQDKPKLEAIIALSIPSIELAEQIETILPDSSAKLDLPMLYITRNDVISILNRYLIGEITAQDVDRWAGAMTSLWLTVADFEPGYVDILEETVDFLTEAETQLSPKDALREINKLTSAIYDPDSD